MTRKLTEAEIEIVKSHPGTRGTASRFTANGVAFHPISGQSMSRGVNVINQWVFWDLSRTQANLIAAASGTNLTFQDVDPEQAERDAIKAQQTQEHIDTIKANGSVCRCGLHA